jgi:hypothetical protein
MAWVRAIAWCGHGIRRHSLSDGRLGRHRCAQRPRHRHVPDACTDHVRGQNSQNSTVSIEYSISNLGHLVTANWRVRMGARKRSGRAARTEAYPVASAYDVVRDTARPPPPPPSIASKIHVSVDMHCARPSQSHGWSQCGVTVTHNNNLLHKMIYHRYYYYSSSAHARTPHCFLVGSWP